MIAAWVAGFAAYQWLSPTGPALVGRAGAAARPAVVGDRRDAPELRRLVRARARARRGRDRAALSVPATPSRAWPRRARRQPRVDRVDGGPPQPGGGVFHGARAAAHDRRGRDPDPLRGGRPRARRRARSRRSACPSHPSRRARRRRSSFALRGRPPRDGGRRASATRGRPRTSTSWAAPTWRRPLGARRRAPRARTSRRETIAALAERRAAAARSTRRGSSGRARSARSNRTPTSTAPCSRTVAVLKLNEEEARIARRRAFDAASLLGARRGRDRRHARLGRGRLGRHGRADPRSRRRRSAASRPTGRGRRVHGRVPRRAARAGSSPVEAADRACARSSRRCSPSA